MRRILVYLLAMMLCLGTAIAEEKPEWKYEKAWGYLGEYSGPGGDVVIPSEVDGNTVRVIQSRGLSDREDITSVTVPEGTIVLGSIVLRSVSSLASVSLPGTLQVIDDFNFFRCDALEEITIPASVRLIGNSVLDWCNGLKAVTFEGPCPVLKNAKTFLGDLSAGTVVYVPDDQLEAYRAALPAVNSDQIRPSGKNALPQPELHAEFTVDPETGTLLRCVSEDAWIDVPAEVDGVPVKKIGENAFRKNDYCYAVTLPEGLEEIGPRAFNDLSHLTYAPIPSTVRVIGEEAYAHYCGFTLTLPEGLKEIPRHAFFRSTLDMELVVPEGVVSIGEEAFDGSNISAVYLPSGLVSVGSKAFRGYVLSNLHFETLALPEIAEDAFKDQNREITVSLPPAAGEAEVAAAQAFFDTLGGKFTVIRLEEPNGVYPDSPYAQPAVTEAPVPETTEPPAATEAPSQEATEAPTPLPAPAPAAAVEGVSMDPEDYVGTWYSVYYGTGGFTGDPRATMDWQDEMILHADGTVEGNLGDDFTDWGTDPEDGTIRVAGVRLVLLPEGFLQYNNRVSGYIIFSRDRDAVWDPETPMYEDLLQAAAGGGEPEPEPTPPPAAPAGGGDQGAGDGTIALDTRYVCVRYGAGGYEMDASVLGAELSVILHADGSLEFIMLGNEVSGLTWSWDGSDAVVDYYNAGQLRFMPGKGGVVNLDFMGTITYILEAQ